MKNQGLPDQKAVERIRAKKSSMIGRPIFTVLFSASGWRRYHYAASGGDGFCHPSNSAVGFGVGTISISGISYSGGTLRCTAQ